MSKTVDPDLAGYSSSDSAESLVFSHMKHTFNLTWFLFSVVIPCGLPGSSFIRTGSVQAQEKQRDAR